MTDSQPDDPADPAVPVEGEREADALDRVTDALAGLAFCLVALQFTIFGVFDGSSFLAVLAGLGLGGFGVVKALNA